LEKDNKIQFIFLSFKKENKISFHYFVKKEHKISFQYFVKKENKISFKKKRTKYLLKKRTKLWLFASLNALEKVCPTPLWGLTGSRREPP
jgi:hypothetical protein